MGYGIFGQKITEIWDIKTPPNGASTIEEFSKAYFPGRNQKGTDATNGMMPLLSLVRVIGLKRGVM